MGVYINPGNAGFVSSRAGRYIDKSALISVINNTIGKPEKLSCVTRPRRFGKSYAAQMLCAYYDKSCDSSSLFDDLEIAKDASYSDHLNKYNVLYIDISDVIGEASLNGLIEHLKCAIREDFIREFPKATVTDSIVDMMGLLVDSGEAKFIAIIDEWDAVIRDSNSTKDLQKEYLEFLRSLFKSSRATDKIFAAAYMTGILPIKKDGSQSAISEFREYTMLAPRRLAEYVGFTEEEVKQLCSEDGMDFSEMKRWYDGYSFEGVASVYNPNSVMYALERRKYESYWAMSSSATSLVEYINMNFDGLSDAAADLLADKRVAVETAYFQNDTVSFESKDDVLTMMIHYGYLSYDAESSTVTIPNEEIRNEFAGAIKRVKNKHTLERVKQSIDLIEATASGNADYVAEQIEKIHRQECAPLHYNKEQSLRSVIKLAYFAYRDYYLQFEELPSGNGYADIVYLPKKFNDYPALIIELKWDDSPDTAINQIKAKHYPDVLKNYDGDILLVGISYDKDDESKKHRCVIEAVEGNV